MRLHRVSEDASPALFGGEGQLQYRRTMGLRRWRWIIERTCAKFLMPFSFLSARASVGRKRPTMADGQESERPISAAASALISGIGGRSPRGLASPIIIDSIKRENREMSQPTSQGRRSYAQRAKGKKDDSPLLNLSFAFFKTALSFLLFLDSPE